MNQRLMTCLSATILVIVHGISAQAEPPVPRTGLRRLPSVGPPRLFVEPSQSLFRFPESVVPASFDSVSEVADGSPVVDGAADEILARLEAAEAEIRALRKRYEDSDDSTAPVAIENATELNNDFASTEYFQQPAGPPDIVNVTPVTIPEDFGGGKITFKPGARIQPRYIYNNATANNDFFINRFRVKASGDVAGLATYGMELKIDGTGGFETQAVGVEETAWLDFPLGYDKKPFLRVGLYDIPFSRDALTSDSKLLLMDRSLIKSELTEKGLADNTIGLMLHGRPLDGRLEYAIGVFDNVVFENTNPDAFENSTKVMPAGRFVWNFLDPPGPAAGYGDYQGSYLGRGERLAVGVNGAYLEEAIELGRTPGDPDRVFTLYAYGIDLFFNHGPWVFEAEYDTFFEGDQTPRLSADGWFVQGGYIFRECGATVWELAGRHEQSNPEDDEIRRQNTSIGVNTYLRNHNLKIQSEYTWRRESTEVQNDLCQVQLQLDF